MSNSPFWFFLARCRAQPASATKVVGAEQSAVSRGGAQVMLTSVSDRWGCLEAEIREHDVTVPREHLGEEFEREGTNAVIIAEWAG